MLGIKKISLLLVSVIICNNIVYSNKGGIASSENFLPTVTPHPPKERSESRLSTASQKTYSSTSTSSLPSLIRTPERKLSDEDAGLFAVRPSGGEVLTIKSIKELPSYIAFLKANPNVVKIECRKFTDQGMIAIAPYCQQLQFLDFSGSP